MERYGYGRDLKNQLISLSSMTARCTEFARQLYFASGIGPGNTAFVKGIK